MPLFIACFSGWNDFVEARIASWENLYLDWLEAAEPSDIEVVHFEELQASDEAMTETLRRVTKFLGISPEHQEHRLACLLRYQDGRFKRRKRRAGVGWWFSGETETR